jgi:hypothetical protein
MRARILFISFLALCPGASRLYGEQSAGLTLLEPSGARSAGLGESFTAVTNDVTAQAYNPASLTTLQSPQASFMVQKGIFEESFGHISLGVARARRAYGISIGYYNAGDLFIQDGGTTRTVTAQTDLTAGVALAQKFGAMSGGLTLKAIRSELIEQAGATALAVDAGVQRSVGPRSRVGATIQNVGNGLRYAAKENPLPRIARVGCSHSLRLGSTPLLVSLEIPYFINESEIEPSLGAEALVGPMALRMGYRHATAFQNISIGTGFTVGRTTVDYAYALVRDLEAVHRISVSIHLPTTSTPGPLVKL